MARNFLRAVLFDLGGTLMYERATWQSVNAHADEALTNYLRAEGLELNLSTFPREFRNRLSKYFQTTGTRPAGNLRIPLSCAMS